MPCPGQQHLSLTANTHLSGLKSHLREACCDSPSLLRLHLTRHTPRSLAPLSLSSNDSFDLLHVQLSPLATTAVSKQQMLNYFFLGGGYFTQSFYP